MLNLLLFHLSKQQMWTSLQSMLDEDDDDDKFKTD